MKWKTVTLPPFPSVAKRINDSSCVVLWSSLKSKATSAFYRQCIYATPGNGLSHAKQIEYFREPGSYFNSYCLLYTLQVPGTVCVLLLSKQLGDSYCDNPHVVDEEMEAQKD